jgi:hypothetical protein
MDQSAFNVTARKTTRNRSKMEQVMDIHSGIAGERYLPIGRTTTNGDFSPQGAAA